MAALSGVFPGMGIALPGTEKFLFRAKRRAETGRACKEDDEDAGTVKRLHTSRARTPWTTDNKGALSL
jgi:hypothetical protein